MKVEKSEHCDRKYRVLRDWFLLVSTNKINILLVIQTGSHSSLFLVFYSKFTKLCQFFLYGVFHSSSVFTTEKVSTTERFLTGLAASSLYGFLSIWLLSKYFQNTDFSFFLSSSKPPINPYCLQERI